MSANSNQKRTTMTISILESDKKTLQKYAIDKDKTVSAIIHEWIQNFCIKNQIQGGDNND